MIINVMKPSSVEAELKGPTSPVMAMAVRPRRWSEKQQSLTVLPIESHADSGALLDSVIIRVNQKTGKLSLHRVGGALEDVELPTEADGKGKK